MLDWTSRDALRVVAVKPLRLVSRKGIESALESISMSDADSLPYALASFLLVILRVDFRTHHGEVTLSGLRVAQHTWQRSRNRGTDAEFQPTTPAQSKRKTRSRFIAFPSIHAALSFGPVVSCDCGAELRIGLVATFRGPLPLHHSATRLRLCPARLEGVFAIACSRARVSAP